jgi:hypothetical protein
MGGLISGQFPGFQIIDLYPTIAFATAVEHNTLSVMGKT